MNYITFNEMIEVNGLLEEKGLNFKVHLRDACGKQSCWIEPLGNCACEGRYEEMYQVVEEYFRSKGQKIEFDETKLNFFAIEFSIIGQSRHEKDLVFWFGRIWSDVRSC